MKRLPRIEIVSTGTEILQGLYPDTNAQWMSRRLIELGLPVSAHAAAPDSREELVRVLEPAADRADLIIVSGGLGPTEDDVNRFAIAEIYGTDLAEDEEAVARMRDHFARRNRPFRESNRVQALMPDGAKTLFNNWGTAPGFLLRNDRRRATLIALPGPPRELRPMFEHWVEPFLHEAFEPSERYVTLTIHTIGLPESDINAAVKDLFDSDPLVRMALLASGGKVDIRLTAHGPNGDKVSRSLEDFRRRIEERIGRENIYGVDDETIESAVAGLLIERSLTLATAESCTAGLIAGRLTEVPGSSEFLLEGFVTYSNESKTRRLGVPSSLVERHGAVSPEVARAMAEGVRKAAGTDLGLAITGISGPTGGSEAKPVGLTYFGLAWPGGSEGIERRFLGNRNENRYYSVNTALDLVRRHLLRQA